MGNDNAANGYENAEANLQKFWFGLSGFLPICQGRVLNILPEEVLVYRKLD